MATLNAYLTFNGNCREAMNFYKDCLGGEIHFQTIGDSPLADKMPEQMRECILHSTLKSGVMTIMGTDLISDQGFQKGNTVSLALNCESEQELMHYFKRLSEEGVIYRMPQETFWGAMYADLVDKYGLQWLLNYDKTKI